MPDFYDLARHFTDEERTVQRTVRAFVEQRVLPTIGDHLEKGTFPTELIPEIAELGLLGCNLHGYGCAGLSEIGYGLAMQELERGDSGVRSFASVQGSLVMYPIHAFGSEEQKKKFLPEMAKAKIIGCFGLTEPDFGSNPSGMRTVARDDGDIYVINGTKRWITNGASASSRRSAANREPSLVRGDARDVLAEDERVDVVRAFVGRDGLEVTEVAHDRVFERDAVAAEDVAADARGLERDADVVALDHRDVRGVELLCFFQAGDFEGLELGARDLGEHLGELRLDELVRRDRFVAELDAVLGVVDGAVEARGRGADDAPRDAEARGREAR